MSTVAFSSPNATDIAQSTRYLVNTLNAQYPLRRAEMELFPTSFCEQLIQETRSFGKPRSPATMPRTIFDSLLDAAAHCVGGDTSSSTLKFGGLFLNQFQLDPAYTFCLFQDGKVVVPHDAVFLTLHHLREHAVLHQLDLQTLVGDNCAFITARVVKRFLSIIEHATLSPPTSSAPAIRMSMFGINVDSFTSFFRQPTGLPSNHQSSTIPLPPNADSVVTPFCTEDQDTSRPGSGRSEISKPSTPRGSRFRATTLFSASHPSSPLAAAAFDAEDSSRSPPSPTLTKRLFQDEAASIRLRKKSRVPKDVVGESSKAGYVSDRRRQRANKSVKKDNRERTPLQVREPDDVPQTSPISKLMPGSFYSRGERVEGGRRKRTPRDKENISSKKGL